MFVDIAKIKIKAGDGGAGAVAFHREKYVAAGGPDGGDGGKGGDVVFVVDDNLATLADFRYKRKYVAKNGENGRGSRQYGKKAPDLEIKVPRGTIIREANSGAVMADMSKTDRFIAAKGGKGGWGNIHFATPTRQVPRFAKPGVPGEEWEVSLELKLLADVGLLGYPSVGKSSLISVVSQAKPKIGDYHFTTLVPNLGVVSMGEGNSFVIADIPGLIEGASEGVGLGHKFLKHIERTKVIIHMIDAASVEGRDPIADIKAINKELEAYNPDLLKRPQVIAANKIDAIYGDTNEVIDGIKKEFEPDIKVFPISAVSGKGLKELLFYVRSLLDEFGDEPVVYEQEYDPFEFQDNESLPYTVEKVEDGLYSVEGPRIERMLGYTNIDSEKGFMFFQNFMKNNGILEELEELGIEDGDTVKIYGHQFDYYK